MKSESAIQGRTRSLLGAVSFLAVPFLTVPFLTVPFLTVSFLAVIGGPLAAQEDTLDADANMTRPERKEFLWNGRTAEHLFNRAGFGASDRTIRAAVRKGHAATVAELLEGEGWIEKPFYSRVRGNRDFMRSLRDLPEEERRVEQRRIRREDDGQMRDFLTWWIERMVRGDDDLRERMTLFWHGHFTSSMQDVRNSHEMIMQNQFLRTNALGNFRKLVLGIARDPAMLEYLDNDANKKGKPNENFARELMELFTLGEGQYDEDDIKEAARAFTGWTDRNGRFRFESKQHDKGTKTVLGVTGDLAGEDVIELLLEQEACPRYLSSKLLAYFEGLAAPEERIERYAAILRDSDYAIHDFMETLFLDPEFYREELLGARITSPLDFLIGTSRRLGLEPPARFLNTAATLLGERLFFPPNVKGWEGGRSWVTTATFMQRGNLAGVLLGVVGVEDYTSYDPMTDPDLADLIADDSMGGEMSSEGTMEASARRKSPRARDAMTDLRDIERSGWKPRYSLTARLRRVKAEGDGDIVRFLARELLAIPIDPHSRREVTALLRSERKSADLTAKGMLEDPARAEPLLRQIAHVILSLPEAQLH